ncbi:hypothetical protein [Curtobacterium sp. PhB136]|uniref:hypothetical protein n=1 Tax=Curtobacterium sp. PhB136 TaxID=2485181 RepID=UPI001053F3E8|nr:hypothetical protein [Curtobacterium sp. PhB136]TCK63615.1 hypothetical protein EDF27_2160 [Curtobacterium sp. PhB136]
MAVSRPDRAAPTSFFEVGAFSYPDHITLSPHAERYLHQLAIDLAAGVVELRQLSPALTQLYVFAYEQGRAARQLEVDHAQHEADRLYVEMCRRQPSREHETIDAFLTAQRHRGAEAAAKRAAEIRAQIHSGQEPQ